MFDIGGCMPPQPYHRHVGRPPSAALPRSGPGPLGFLGWPAGMRGPRGSPVAPPDWSLHGERGRSGSDRGDVMLFKRWAENFSDDLAIDLGTANTLVFVPARGLSSMNPPSWRFMRLNHSILIYCKSVRIAGDQLDEAILQHIRKHYNLLIGERRAEEIKIHLGSAYPGEGERAMDVKGRDLVDGFPKSVVLTEDEIREALRDSVMTIVETVRTCLEQTPPELAAISSIRASSSPAVVVSYAGWTGCSGRKSTFP